MDTTLEDFYDALINNRDFRKLDIPRSEIFYIRAAVKNKYGYEATLSEIEKIVLEEYEAGNLEAPEDLIRELRSKKL